PRRRRPAGHPRRRPGPVGAGSRRLPARRCRHQRPEPVHRPGHRDHRRCGDGPGGPAVRPLPGGVVDVRRSGARPRPGGRRPRQCGRQGDDSDRGGPMSTCHATSLSRRGPRRRLIALLVATAALALTAACSPSGPGDDPDPSGTNSGAGEDETLTVFAAASLAAPMDDLLAMFAEDHPEVTIQPAAYDGSSTLVTQLTEGAHADVLATANTATMDDLVAAFPD